MQARRQVEFTAWSGDPWGCQVVESGHALGRLMNYIELLGLVVSTHPSILTGQSKC